MLGVFRPSTAGACEGLFPEFAASGALRVVIGEGLLRAAPRGAASPPVISAVAVRDGAAVSPADRVGPERVLADHGWEDPSLLARAAAARRDLVAARVGGEWWRDGDGEMPAAGDVTVVALAEPPVCGQRRPDRATLLAMLDAALAGRPAGRLLILASDAVRRRLHGRLRAAASAGAHVIGPAVDPWRLLDRAVRVYSAGGEIGFLALLAGIPVSAFGDAFYTGWGATDDACGGRPFRRSVDEIFAASCLVATRYRDPFRDSRIGFEEALAILADWRRIDEANRRIAVCVGMSFWKRRRIADFVGSSAGAPVFRRSLAGALAAAGRRGAKSPGAIAGWASRLPLGLAEAAAQKGVPLIRVEDGFIRSVGLGSDFLPPASLVFDSRGMYYDPGVPSDLEVLLGDAEFTPALIERAERLIELLVSRGISKYNLAGRHPDFDPPAGRRRILVPGQVEDDLSILRGGAAVRTNLALLTAARAADPDAFIIYKPHPDVLAGHRHGAVPAGMARRFADLVLPDAAIPALLDRVDEVHTMTSLSGFEALLRGRHVVVYGRPFYAGWGLTEDRLPVDRGRRLSLAQLVAGALILYPRYLDPLTRLPCGPEIVIERLDRPELWRAGPLIAARRWQGAAARRLAAWRAALLLGAIGPLRGLRARPRS
jgi:capsular polysaccharide export protein